MLFARPRQREEAITVVAGISNEPGALRMLSLAAVLGFRSIGRGSIQ